MCKNILNFLSLISREKNYGCSNNDGMQRVLLFTNQPLLAQQLAKTTGMGNTFEKSSLKVAFFLRANFLVNTAYVYSWVFSTIVFHQSISL